MDIFINLNAPLMLGIRDLGGGFVPIRFHMPPDKVLGGHIVARRIHALAVKIVRIPAIDHGFVLGAVVRQNPRHKDQFALFRKFVPFRQGTPLPFPPRFFGSGKGGIQFPVQAGQALYIGGLESKVGLDVIVDKYIGFYRRDVEHIRFDKPLGGLYINGGVVLGFYGGQRLCQVGGIHSKIRQPRWCLAFAGSVFVPGAHEAALKYLLAGDGFCAGFVEVVNFGLGLLEIVAWIGF
jgi:hypothetical protein